MVDKKQKNKDIGIIYPNGLQKIIDNFYSGKLDERRDKKPKKIAGAIREAKYFPDKGVSSLTIGGDTPCTLF